MENRSQNSLKKFLLFVIPKERLVTCVIVLSALFFALLAEHFLKIAPCTLCTYQRYVFLSIFFTCLFKNARSLRIIFLCLGIILSVYHLGLERTWWEDVLHTCAVKISSAITLDSFRAQFSEMQPACGDTPWIILGMSAVLWTLLLQLILLSYIGWIYAYFKKTPPTS